MVHTHYTNQMNNHNIQPNTIQGFHQETLTNQVEGVLNPSIISIFPGILDQCKRYG